MKYLAINFMKIACILSLSTNIFASNHICSKKIPLTNKYPTQYNIMTQKAIELQNYDNQQQENKYYPSNLTKKQSQKYLIDLFHKNPVDKLDPAILRYAIGSCDLENIAIYLDHGLSLHCYTQEGQGNIIGFLSNCRKPNEIERNQALERLLQVGANPNEGKKDLERDAAGTYPIADATQACDTSMLDILLRYGANPNLKTKGDEYFPILNICSTNRNYSGLGLPPELDYPPTRTMPLAHILQSLIEHGADPNTIYITDDERNFANQDQDKVLKKACSGQDKNAKSVYDLYTQEFTEAKVQGDPVKISNYQKLMDILVKYEAKPLIDLCQTLKDE